MGVSWVGVKDHMVHASRTVINPRLTYEKAACKVSAPSKKESSFLPMNNFLQGIIIIYADPRGYIKAKCV